MDPILEQAIEHACEKLSIAYARAVDFRDYDQFANLFAEHGVLDVGRPMAGRAAISKAMSRRPDELRSRHVLSNIFTQVHSPTRASGISYLTLYRHLGEASLQAEAVKLQGPAAVGHYQDSFEQIDGQWLFTSRKLHLAFRDPDQFPD